MSTESFGGEKRYLFNGPETVQLKEGRGRIHRVLIHAMTAASGGINVWDAVDVNTNRVWAKDVANGLAAGQVYKIDCPLENGVRVTSAIDVDATIIYS